MEYYIKNNIIKKPIIYHHGVRDDPDINVYIESDT